jgi:hypothetical protein
MRPAWTYEIVPCRLRHRRGYYYNTFKLCRNDGKVIKQSDDLPLIEKVKARFEAWAIQKWKKELT